MPPRASLRPFSAQAFVLLQDGLEAKGLKRHALADEMLAHGLDPVQAQGVEHGAGALHDAEDGDGEGEPHVKGDDGHGDAEGAGAAEGVADGHGPQHDAELLVGEREGPEAQVGCRVRDAVEAEFFLGDRIVSRKIEGT